MKTEQYIISGMSCAACSASVTRVVSRLEGVEICEVNLITGKMTVRFNPEKVGEADFKRVIEKAGFGIEPAVKDFEPPKPAIKDKKDTSFLSIIISALASGLLLYISMGQMLFKELPLPDLIDINKNPFNFALTQLLLCLIPLVTGRRFFTNGIPLLLKGHPNMDSLVALGAGASFLYSIAMTYTISNNSHAVHSLYYESVAVVITLVMLGKLLEGKSRKKTADAIKKLMELAPDTCFALRDGKEYTIPTAKAVVGDILVVKAGAKIPLDAVIIEGSSSVNEAMLTGESLPIQKNVGDKVTGGSINIDGLLYIKVTHTGADTTLSKIISFVEQAQSKKAPISKVADKVSGIFVPAVMVIALTSAIVWFIVNRDFAFSLKIFTSILVVACPCALGLATPTALMVGTGLGATKGILIRNGEILEAAHKVRVAVFDKTGTVTKGNTIVTDIKSENELQLIELAAIAEKGSEHPLSKAILSYAETMNIKTEKKAKNFKNLSGMGLCCEVNRAELLIGNQKLLEENQIDISPFEQQAQDLSSQGKSIIYVVLDKKLLGIIAVADQIKESSKQAVTELKKMGLKTVLLSGDNRPCAEYIAHTLDFDLCYSEVLPEEKAGIIENLKTQYGSTLMVGDGINDAPALTVADIGCAIGSGSDIAIESADIVLMRDDPMDVARAIRLSRLTLRNIKQNLFWAFCYNTALIPVAAGILYALGGPLLNPMLAGLAMSLSSVFVVTNALRLRLKKL